MTIQDKEEIKEILKQGIEQYKEFLNDPEIRAIVVDLVEEYMSLLFENKTMNKVMKDYSTMIGEAVAKGMKGGANE